MTSPLVSDRERKIISLSPDCPGSWRPFPGKSPGDPVRCLVCGRDVQATAPPPDAWVDPWRGSTDARVLPHWARP
jgi:hypothetical protein